MKKSDTKPVEELKEKIHKKKEEEKVDESKGKGKVYDPFSVTGEPGVPPEVGQVPKDSIMDFTHIAGIGKAKNEEIIKKLEELGVDTTPGPKVPPVTVPSEELYRLIFNDILAKRHERPELTMALDEDELKRCGMATDMMLELHGGNWMAHFVEVNFFLTIGGILAPRVVLLIKNMLQRRQENLQGRQDVGDYAPQEAPPPTIPDPEIPHSPYAQKPTSPKATRGKLGGKKKKT